MGDLYNLFNGSAGSVGPYDVGLAKWGYNSYIEDEKKKILNDTRIDAVSKNELYDALIAHVDQIGQPGPLATANPRALADSSIAEAEAGLAKAQSDDPFYKGRRFTQDLAQQQLDMPGQMQTILTQREYTPLGTPTLLTSTPGSNLVPQPATLLGGQKVG